ERLRHEGESALWLALVPTVAILFNLHQRTNLIWSFTAMQWQYVNFFSVLALWLLATREIGWRALLNTAIAAGVAMFSSGSGVVIWIAILLVMPLRGYRNPLQYILWLLLLAGLLYVHRIGDNDTAVGMAGDLFSNLSITNIFTFLASFISGPIVPIAVQAPSTFLSGASVGLILVLLPLTVFAWGRRLPLPFWTGLVLLSFGSGLLTALSRAELPYLGADTRFVSMAMLYWVGAIGLFVTALPLVPETLRSVAKRGVIGVLVLLTLLVMWGNTVIWTWSINARPIPFQLHEDVHRFEDTPCFWSLLITEDAACMISANQRRAGAYYESVRAIFDRRLTLYAGYDEYNPATPRLPFYQQGEPVIIAGERRYQQARDVTYRAIPAPDRIETVPPSEIARLMGEPPSPPLDTTAGLVLDPASGVERLVDVVGLSPRVW
ncbi:MAG: hypothetical protein AAF125_24485, partial [Chloroflexota bacterium]